MGRSGAKTDAVLRLQYNIQLVRRVRYTAKTVYVRAIGKRAMGEGHRAGASFSATNSAITRCGNAYLSDAARVVHG